MARAGSPRLPAVRAAPTVPEWRMPRPVFGPRLMPDTTIRGRTPSPPETPAMTAQGGRSLHRVGGPEPVDVDPGQQDAVVEPRRGHRRAGPAAVVGGGDDDDVADAGRGRGQGRQPGRGHPVVVGDQHRRDGRWVLVESSAVAPARLRGGGRDERDGHRPSVGAAG